MIIQTGVNGNNFSFSMLNNPRHEQVKGHTIPLALGVIEPIPKGLFQLASLLQPNGGSRREWTVLATVYSHKLSQGR